MMKQLFDWLEHRTGARKVVNEALYENIPGGSRWRYVWGSTLTFTLAVQFITGIFLWMGYAPSATSAWESVHYIQEQMTGGWFLRGLHHWTAQVMTVLLVLHLMQVVIDGAYKAPREVNFWFGVLLLQLVLALSLTGYLLPWDQKGYWATKVATDILGSTPLVGSYLKELVLGGADYGHHTLTRFFALHAGVLPAAVIALTAGHIYLFRRHGITAKTPLKKRDEYFWPEQVLKDAVACLAVLATVLFFVVKYHGAHLDAPADPSSNYPARPDWYFLFLFQFLKYFPGHWEVLGAVVIPGIVMTLIFLMPILGKWKLGHRFNIGLLCAVLIGAGTLTISALREDKANVTYQASVKQAANDAIVVKDLAKTRGGIPPDGALVLLQGPKLFAQHCAGCHAYGGHNGLLAALSGPQSAPDLKGFATREYLTALLDPAQFKSTKFFGGTKHANGKMAKFLEENADALAGTNKVNLAKVIKAVSAEAGIQSQRPMDTRDATEIAEGKKQFETLGCTDCHSDLGKWNAEDSTAPDLTGYGSRDWMMALLHDPSHERFYGKKNDRMPAFGKDQKLSRQQLERIVDWLRGE